MSNFVKYLKMIAPCIISGAVMSAGMYVLLSKKYQKEIADLKILHRKEIVTCYKDVNKKQAAASKLMEELAIKEANMNDDIVNAITPLDYLTAIGPIAYAQWGFDDFDELKINERKIELFAMGKSIGIVSPTEAYMRFLTEEGADYLPNYRLTEIDEETGLVTKEEFEMIIEEFKNQTDESIMEWLEEKTEDFRMQADIDNEQEIELPDHPKTVIESVSLDEDGTTIKMKIAKNLAEGKEPYLLPEENEHPVDSDEDDDFDEEDDISPGEGPEPLPTGKEPYFVSYDRFDAHEGNDSACLFYYEGDNTWIDDDDTIVNADMDLYIGDCKMEIINAFLNDRAKNEFYVLNEDLATVFQVTCYEVGYLEATGQA